MKLEQLLDMENLLRRIGEGMIRERQHPGHPSLRILGYTEAAQWTRTWDAETTQCRGLIYEAGSGEVLARPWPKFFNVGEHDQEHLAGAELDLQAPVQVTDKMDGSLGIVFRNPFTGLWEVATRGSFDSDQARKANAELLPWLLADPLNPAWQPADGWTYLTEIIYPENRIVLDYAGDELMALLGAVRIETGEVRGPEFDEHWPGKRAEVFPVNTLAEALAMEPRPNAEGLVVRYAVNGTMVKIKQEDYVRLHKLVTGLSDKAVWEHLSEGKPIAEMAAAIPDEFHDWLMRTADQFNGAYRGVEEEFERDWARVLAATLHDVKPAGGAAAINSHRKEFAAHAKKTKRPWLLFAHLDGRDLAPMIWKELRPVGVRYMNEAAREDVA